jgi:8-oxo-dGTP pyrophosphatase MutT (NUDIX family)
MEVGTLNEKARKLERLVKNRIAVKITGEDDIVHAAVMMILRSEPKDLSMLFIKRPESDLDAFSGHMAFPGGKMKKGDESKLHTALRETHEEIGVDLGVSADVLGELDDVNPNNPRASNFIVTPYLSLLKEEVVLKPNILEVEAAVWVPIRHLMDEKNATVRLRERKGRMVEDYVYNYDPYIIWGMTGRIVHQFLSFSSHIF